VRIGTVFGVGILLAGLALLAVLEWRRRA
jgi:hypothetical protein